MSATRAIFLFGIINPKSIIPSFLAIPSAFEYICSY